MKYLMLLSLFFFGQCNALSALENIINYLNITKKPFYLYHKEDKTIIQVGFSERDLKDSYIEPKICVPVYETENNEDGHRVSLSDFDDDYCKSNKNGLIAFVSMLPVIFIIFYLFN